MARVITGCCGWGFFRPKLEFGPGRKQKFSSTLAAYASRFPLAEANSTFYRIPKLATARRWLSEAREQNPEFEFTVKAFQGITHAEKFGGKSLSFYNDVKKTCLALKTKILLFQTPASFGPSEENFSSMRAFFSKAGRGKLAFAWEPRGAWLKEPKKIREACEEFRLIECVDPLRAEPATRNAKLAYFRLHGFGKPMMYNYRFTDSDLRRAKKSVLGSGAETCYVLFNNYYMYDDAKRFVSLLK